MNAGALRRSLVDHCVALEAHGLNHGTTGNLSVRHGDGLLVTPSGIASAQMRAEDIVPMDAEGEFTGPLKPTSEWRFHRDILAARADVNAVVHTHATYCTVLAIRRMDIPPLHYMIAAAGGPSIRCSAYATFGTAALSEAALAALDGRLACLLANHGMIACGATLEKAFALAVEVEELARQYVLTLQLGGPVLLDDDEIERVIGKFRTYGVQPARERD